MVRLPQPAKQVLVTVPQYKGLIGRPDFAGRSAPHKPKLSPRVSRDRNAQGRRGKTTHIHDALTAHGERQKKCRRLVSQMRSTAQKSPHRKVRARIKQNKYLKYFRQSGLDLPSRSGDRE